MVLGARRHQPLRGHHNDATEPTPSSSKDSGNGNDVLVCTEVCQRNVNDSMLSAILWQNAAQTVTLFDLPTSISLAQGIPGRITERRLLSSEPLQEPFPSNKPGSLSAEVKSSQNTVADDLHAQFKSLIAEALQQISNTHVGDWCLPRAIVPKEAFRIVGDLSSTGKETVSDIPGQASSSISEPNFHAYVKNLSYLSSFASPPRQICLSSLVSTGNVRLEDLSDIWNSVLSNDMDRMTIIEIPFQTSIYTFCIPPNSSFVLSRLQGSCLQDPVYNEPSRSRVEFDFILMDPPWPNASAKRRRSYDGPATLRGIKDLLSSIPAKDLLAQAGLLGIWVTNKQALRDVILGRKGMFNVWGIELIEEWIWLKTTVKGEPIIDIDSSWRKPYEVLLIGRRTVDQKGEQPVKRRVVVSVPDLHSRKPCIRELISQLEDLPKPFRALEIFARYLVAEWWSWGDEVLKYNWDGHWLR